MAITHVDVLIVGAGLSGIGAACRLRTEVPDRTFAVLEARGAIGGTWDLFRYPGVRSDSDMFTLGYPFRPWRNPEAISDGGSILAYIRETALLYGVTGDIRFHHRVVGASWSSAEARWTVTVRVGPEEHTAVYTCAFLYLCSGYYDSRGGHEVEFPGRERFAGRIVHPQQWPANLDHRGRRVVVVGSGATAVTLVPALAARAAQVTMLQRSPSYVVAVPSRDRLADRLRAALPARWAHRAVRGKNVLLTIAGYSFLRRFPDTAARLLRRGVAKRLPATVPVDPHFAPRYAPWDQRLCLAPDGDLFDALRSRRAEIVTDRIVEFTPDGLRLASGRLLEADIVVTATGLAMVAFGRIRLTVDGRAVDPGGTLVYKGMMFDGIPNLAWCIGYINNSWTLRADLTSRFVCRVLNYMSRRQYAVCTPRAGLRDLRVKRPILDLASGYIQRAAERLPKQGVSGPWRFPSNYLRDLVVMRLGRVRDRRLRFARQPESTGGATGRIEAEQSGCVQAGRAGLGP